MTNDDRAVCVRAAIARIKAADQQYRDVQMNPSSSLAQRCAASLQRESVEAEFRWQWESVEILLDERDAKR